MATKISLKKLRKAAYNFSANNVITSGKMGNVYKAKAILPNGTFMACQLDYYAVKRFHASNNIY